MDLSLLQRLVDVPGVPGREGQVRALIRDVAVEMNFFDTVEEDPLGNLICRRRGKDASSPRLLMVAHMDQAGFLVSQVSDDGTLRLHPVGTCDLRSLASQPVWVVSSDGTRWPGTVQRDGHPVHTATEADLFKQPKLSDFYVDLGLNVENVRAMIQPGDMVVFRMPFETVGGDITAAGLDDRIGCWAMLVALPLIQQDTCDLAVAFTIQEELGSRGAGAVARAVVPDIAIICETVVSCAVPGVAASQHVTVPGQGIALQVADSSLLSDIALVACAEKVAERLDLSTQRSLMLGGGQDGAIVQRSGQGVRTLALGCPLKFMHASREHANRADVLSYPLLIAGLVDAIQIEMR